MAEIKNMKRLLKKLKTLEKDSKAKDNTKVVVGYTANYAVYVHENLEMKWKGVRRGKEPKTARKTNRKKAGSKNSGAVKKKRSKWKYHGRYWSPQGRAQAKFLEKPARELQHTLTRLVVQSVKLGNSLSMALLKAGMRLQRESQKLVPVDTGNLKASAFTKVEK